MGSKLKKLLILVGLLGIVGGAGYAFYVYNRPVDYTRPSESKPYPDLKQHPNAWVHVSLKKQRVYIMDGNKALYTMYGSSGMDNLTPTGNYTIQPERGTFFYNPNEKQGARDWVSWKGHGVYLFHSVPVDQENHILKNQTKYLGKKPSSHGCVRLTLPDAHWMSKNLPVGMKVSITNS